MAIKNLSGGEKTKKTFTRESIYCRLLPAECFTSNWANIAGGPNSRPHNPEGKNLEKVYMSYNTVVRNNCKSCYFCKKKFDNFLAKFIDRFVDNYHFLSDLEAHLHFVFNTKVHYTKRLPQYRLSSMKVPWGRILRCNWDKSFPPDIHSHL